MKKLLSIAVALMLTVASAGSVFACGSHHGRSKSYSVCSVKSCVKTGLHTHGGKSYSAHYYGDGHKYHEYCDLEYCDMEGYHAHNNVYCFEHTRNDGHSYHK